MLLGINIGEATAVAITLVIRLACSRLLCKLHCCLHKASLLKHRKSKYSAEELYLNWYAKLVVSG